MVVLIFLNDGPASRSGVANTRATSTPGDLGPLGRFRCRTVWRAETVNERRLGAITFTARPPDEGRAESTSTPLGA